MPFREIFHSRNVLITGHTGFKGSWLTAWLKELGAQVTGVALDPPTKPSHFLAAQLGEGIQDLRIDIRDQKALKEVILTVQPEFVFHLAAQPLVRQSYSNPVDTYATNVMGTLHLLEALREAAKGQRVLLVLDAEVLPLPEGRSSAENDVLPGRCGESGSGEENREKEKESHAPKMWQEGRVGKEGVRAVLHNGVEREAWPVFREDPGQASCCWLTGPESGFSVPGV